MSETSTLLRFIFISDIKTFVDKQLLDNQPTLDNITTNDSSTSINGENSQGSLVAVDMNETQDSLIYNHSGISSTEVNKLRSQHIVNLLSLRSMSIHEIYNKYKETILNYNIYTTPSSWVDNISSCRWKNEKDSSFTSFYFNRLNNLNVFNISFTLLTDYKFFIFLQKNSKFNIDSFSKNIKLRLHKFFLKKKKLKKLNIIKKIKKISLFKKLKKTFFNISSLTSPLFRNFSSSSVNLLTRRIPLSRRVVDTTNIDFFYKLNKQLKNSLLAKNLDYFSNNFSSASDFTIYLRNYHQKPYLKLRKARLVHWNLFFSKTIRKQRYKTFIKRYIRSYSNLSYLYSFLVNFFTNFKVSWFRLNKLESFSKTNLVELSSFGVLKLPLLFSKILKWKILKYKNLSARKHMSKWSYLNFKRATCPWLQPKKNSPKVSVHLQPNIFYFNYLSYWDTMTGYLLFDESLHQHSLPVSEQFKTNFLLKLHMYRYKATKKCI